MATPSTVTATIKLAWWLPVYVWLLVFFCMLMHTEPDWEKLERVVVRALRIRLS